MYEDLLGQAPEWHGHALCAEVDAELFFPEKGQSPRPALRICGRCEPSVRTACLDDALRDEGSRPGGVFGVRGGKTAKQREILLGKRKPSGGKRKPSGKAVADGAV